MRGPVPKRSAERRRRNRDSRPERIEVEEAAQVNVPRLPQATHPIARRWYRSLRESSQATLFEPSDWAAALLLAESLTRLLQAPQLSASGLDVCWRAMGDLLTTEASRRRARVEVDRVSVQKRAQNVTVIDDYRDRLQG